MARVIVGRYMARGEGHGCHGGIDGKEVRRPGAEIRVHCDFSGAGDRQSPLTRMEGVG